MLNTHELRLLMLVAHAASQQQYHWLHPDTLRDACILLQGSHFSRVPMHALQPHDWQALVQMFAALCKDMWPDSPLLRALRQDELLASLLHDHMQNCVKHGAKIIVWGDRHYSC